jgi:hypothetical protein
MAHRATAAELASYACADYLTSKWSQDGLYDVAAQVWLIESADKAVLHGDVNFLEVGRPGVDGIAFGYRRGESGVWAYYPYEKRFQRLADSINEFVVRWTHKEIFV